MTEQLTSAGLDGINLSDLENFWSAPMEEREAAFAVLRRQPTPVHFDDPDYREYGLEMGAGYYALVKHEDVTQASRRPEVFSSAHGGVTNILDLPDEYAEYVGSMINMDDPRHARLRRIVSRAFTRRSMEQLTVDIEASARKIVDGIAEKGECDFVVDVASRLPLQVICDMLGLPPSDHDFILRRSNQIFCGFDPEFVSDPAEIGTQILNATAQMTELVQGYAADRRKRPADDLISAMVTTNIDGESLTDEEVGSFFLLLAVAANETTRNAIAHGLTLLTDNPDQRELLVSDFARYGPTAVEEIVRLSSPIIFMRRTVVQDCVINGHRYEEGDKALLFYWSANRDEEVFADPGTFDITRSPNPHVGFGAPGPHFCLGAHLARAEISAIFQELLTRLPDLRSGEPDRLRGSSFINAIKHLPCTFTPVPAGPADR